MGAPSPKMALALIIALFPVFLIPLVAFRGALSRKLWFAFSLALFSLLVFIPFCDPPTTGAITLSMMLGGVPPLVAFLLAVYVLLVGCALGCLIAGLAYRAPQS